MSPWQARGLQKHTRILSRKSSNSLIAIYLVIRFAVVRVVFRGCWLLYPGIRPRRCRSRRCPQLGVDYRFVVAFLAAGGLGISAGVGFA